MNIPIAAEPIFHLGHFAVTNAYINSCLVTLIFVVFAIIFRRSIKLIPGRLQSGMEALLEFLLGYFDQVTGSREKSLRFLPLAGTLFIFILLSNWLGLLPGTGSIGRWLLVDGKLELVPVLRSANSDLNLTLAMALVSVITSHLIGMFTLGFFTHWNKFIQLGTIWKAVLSGKPMNIMTGLVEFGVGLLELVSEAAKVLSLSLRLFGNVFAGEVLMTVISSLISWLVPLPLMALELIVGIVQATVFTMLTLVYLTVMSAAPHGSGHEDEYGAAEGQAAAAH